MDALSDEALSELELGSDRGDSVEHKEKAERKRKARLALIEKSRLDKVVKEARDTACVVISILFP